MTPTPLSPPAPLSTTAGRVPTVDSPVRISLNTRPGRRGAVDGARWPCSCDAAGELPRLIAAVGRRLGRNTLRVGRRLGRNTLRVGLRLTAWEHIRRRMHPVGRKNKGGYTADHPATFGLPRTSPA
ncbi:DUF5994 family protein [Planobispora siamensis]|uniref:Uncharacterized protein n=1 Tax=Planobispora siamensis TaxID=936338 RepID=A0A8J3SVC6_9ACTN|nr:DUF5994 family protein [Planobispora siamensis]GIH96253.1 hypothetical protein Psi01_68830 [Planobispora siamensis]